MSSPTPRRAKVHISMRSTLAVSAVCALAGVVGACGGDDGGGGGETQSSAQAKNCGPEGQYLIGMSQANNAEPYRERMNDDIKTAASKVPQFEVKFADAAQDNAKQVSDVENFLTQ